MITLEMLRLALKFILLLKTYLGTANYVLNTSQVTWEDAQKICNIPSVDDVKYLKREDTEVPKTFTAWTSSRNRSSDWTSFYGCLDVSIKIVQMGVIKKTLNEYFPKSIYAITSDSVFKCAYFCTIQSDFFTFFKNICKCIHHYELKSYIEKMPVCIRWRTTVNTVDQTYSASRYTLPIFRFEKDLRTKIIHKSSRESHKHHCLSKQNGTFITNACNARKNFICEGGVIGHATWSKAINTCLRKNSPISKNEVDFRYYWDYWLPYFKYEEGHITTLVFENRDDRLSRDSTDFFFGGTIETLSTSYSDLQRLGKAKNEIDLYTRILMGGAAFFPTIIMFLLVIIYFQRRKLMKAYFTSLTPRQDENNYNEIPETTVSQYYAVEPLYENTASGCQCSVQQNIDELQHIVTAGYPVHSNVQETSEGHYSIISE